MTTLAKSSLDAFNASLTGNIVLPQSANYEEVRAIWNAMIDRRPAIIVQCESAADIQASLTFAQAERIEISIRGAGHNIAGNAIRDDRLMIDLSGMRSVSVETATGIVTIAPGATLGDIDAATQPHGLAVPTGINSTTGISGLTLGGGIGWLTRKHGMTVDNLISAEVATADGRLVTASETENADLFWALCGGGGNFGIVTSWVFQAHPVGDVLAGLIVFPASERKSVLEQYREFAPDLPWGSCAWAVLRKAPPLPFLPEAVHGQDVLILPFCHNGDPEEGQKHLETMQAFGNPHGVHAGVMPFANWQQAFDPLLGEGARNYWKSHNFTTLSDECVDTLIEYASALPHPESEIFLGHIEGHANTIAPEATAYPHRHTNYVVNMHGRWQNAEDDEFCIQWARDLFAATKPFAAKGVYINFMTEEEVDRIKDGFGPNFERLVEVKTKYDPNNIFNLNQNIKPA